MQQPLEREELDFIFELYRPIKQPDKVKSKQLGHSNCKDLQSSTTSSKQLHRLG